MSIKRKWFAAVAALIVVACVVAVANGAFSGHTPRTASPSPSTAARPAQLPQPLRPVSSPPSQSLSATGATSQQAEDAKIAAEAPPAGQWAAVEALSPPTPNPSLQFPSIPATERQNPDSYATAFVAELLNINFASAPRSSLLSWAVSETSPETTPGTPALAASKFLYFNLISPGGPTPSEAAWTSNAAENVTWSASGVTVSVAPAWSQAIASGWQPPDLRMDFLDVTGNLTVTQTGRSLAVKPFSLQLGLGSAEYHHGYGAMSLNNWTVG